MVVVSRKNPACQTDENGIKSGSNLNNADKRVAKRSRAEFWSLNNLYSMLE